MQSDFRWSHAEKLSTYSSFSVKKLLNISLCSEPLTLRESTKTQLWRVGERKHILFFNFPARYISPHKSSIVCTFIHSSCKHLFQLTVQCRNHLVTAKTSRQTLQLSSRDSDHFSKWKKWWKQAGFAQRLARWCMLPDSLRAPPRGQIRSGPNALVRLLLFPVHWTTRSRTARMFVRERGLFTLVYDVQLEILLACPPPHHLSPGDLHFARRLFLL